MILFGLLCKEERPCNETDKWGRICDWTGKRSWMAWLKPQIYPAHVENKIENSYYSCLCVYGWFVLGNIKTPNLQEVGSEEEVRWMLDSLLLQDLPPCQDLQERKAMQGRQCWTPQGGLVCNPVQFLPWTQIWRNSLLCIASNSIYSPQTWWCATQ